MLGVLRKACPFPTIDEKKSLHPGVYLDPPKHCVQCQTRSCVDHLKSGHAKYPTHAVCEFTYSTILIPTPFGNLLVNGVFIPFYNQNMQPRVRKANRQNKITWEQIQKYSVGISYTCELLVQEVDRKARENIGTLHDIQTAVNFVFRAAEEIVYRLPGKHFTDKVEKADPTTRTLLNATDLLRSRLAMMSIIANPESARHGVPKPWKLYRVFHKIVRLFEAEANIRGVKLTMEGHSQKEPLVYDSFETIPLVLIDNAVKYAYTDSEIKVKVNDKNQVRPACEVEVESWGDIVPESEREHIFERRYRSRQAEDVVGKGSGLGLYLAKLVGDAHGFRIRYDAVPMETNPRTGFNVFSFVVESVTL